MTKIQYTSPIRAKISRIIYGISLVLLVLASCKKEVDSALPGNTEDMALNFYAATDVMDAAYAPNQASVAVYVDKFQEQSNPISTNSGNTFPYFAFGFKDGRSFPASNTDGMNYIRYNAGNHRLMFTDVTNAVVLDTTIVVNPKSFDALYLADKATLPGAPAEYELVVAQEDNKTIADKTGIRFIHLSADAGNITCNLQKLNGDLVSTQAGEMAFGQVSAYQYFGIDEAATGGLIRFTLSNAANGVKFNTGVPFAAGRNYVILISGFRTDQQRLVTTGKNADGSIKKETITIGSNLRAEARRSY